MKQRKDGLYSSNIYLGMENGKRKYKTVYGKTQKEVKAKVAQLKVQMGKGIDVTSDRDIFKTWIDKFLQKKEREDLTAAYLTALRARAKHLEPLYYDEIKKISVSDIDNVLASLTGWRCDAPPLSRRTIGSIKDVAYQVFEYAIVSRVIDFNPAKYATIPKSKPSVTRTAISNAIIQQIIDTPHRAQLAAMIMLYAGLRRGEVIALTWPDINLREGFIRVNKAVEFDNGRPLLKSTKTEAGDRIVNIPSILIDYLKSIERDSDNLLVVHSAKGTMYTSSGWRRLWKSYMADLNVKYGYNGNASKHNPKGLKMKIETFTAHQLRHTFATMCYLSGMDVLDCKEQMGHAHIETTLGIYSHLNKEHKRKNTKKLDDYIASCK